MAKQVFFHDNLKVAQNLINDLDSKQPNIDTSKTPFSVNVITRKGDSDSFGGAKIATINDSLFGGGQGSIFDCDLKYHGQDLLFKAFEGGGLNKFVIDKLKTFLEKTPLINDYIDQICWPLALGAIEIDGKQHIVGYFMRKIDGVPLYDFLTGNPNKIKGANLERFNRVNQLDILIQLAELFGYLHNIKNNEILIGDVKTGNIVVDNNFKIHLVDADSFQAFNYQCFSGTMPYLDPDFYTLKPDYIIQNGLFYIPNIDDLMRNYYRTLRNDDYAIAVLFFKVLLFDVNPFDCRDFYRMPEQLWEEDINNYDLFGGYNLKLAAERQFIYGLDDQFLIEDSNRENGKSKWKVGWSHLPSFIKEAFIAIFKDGEHIEMDEWVDLFTKYKTMVTNGELARLDPTYNDPFPNWAINNNKLNFSYEYKGFDLRATIIKIFKENDIKINDIETINNIVKVLNSHQRYKVDGHIFKLKKDYGTLKVVSFIK